MDASASTEGLATYWSSLDARLEIDIHNWVKASIESSLGQLGTVGATAMDDFLLKIKKVFKEIVSSLSVHGTSLSNAELPVSVVPEVLSSVGQSVPGSAGSVGNGSVVPTLFGDRGSVSAYKY